jgi:hypothetical protein
VTVGGARFRRAGTGLVISLTEQEVTLLRAIPGELRPLLETHPDRSNPVSDRLFPRAYSDPTEEAAEEEWQEMVRPELVRERLSALARVAETLEGAPRRGGAYEVELDDDETSAWLSALNDARLALGTRLGITEDVAPDAVPTDHPDASAYAVYDWLTHLQGGLVETVLGEPIDDRPGEGDVKGE